MLEREKMVMYKPDTSIAPRKGQRKIPRTVTKTANGLDQCLNRSNPIVAVTPATSNSAEAMRTGMIQLPRLLKL